jgi:hypothetical protein
VADGWEVRFGRLLLGYLDSVDLSLAPKLYLGFPVVHVSGRVNAGRAGAHPYRAGAHRYRAGTRPYLTKSLGEHASTAQQSPSSLSDG